MPWIELEGAANVRDVGGLPTGDGRQTAARRLLRSDNLQGLTGDDVSRLVDDLGVTTVIDLRSPPEVSAEGPGPLTKVSSVAHLARSVDPEGGDVGPDLSAAGIHISPEDIVEGVLWPNRTVKPGLITARE